MFVASCVHALVPLPGMGRGKFRTLKELYQYGTQQTQPFTFETEVKARSCNVRATWCSSCLHFQRVAAKVGVGIGEFIDKTNKGKRTSRCSYTDTILFFPSSSTPCNHWQHTSSEASNIVIVSSSHDSFSENAESQATFRDSHSCKDVESLLNVRTAQSCRGSVDTLKDLTNFGYRRFSNQLQRQLDILDDNISCISKSDSANLAIGIRYEEAYVFYYEDQNFAEEPPPAVVIPNRSDQSAISSLKDFHDCAISLKGELSECSSEQVESSLARAEELCGLGSRKSSSVAKNSIMQESGQIQQANTRVVIDLMDEVIVCDICGDAGDVKKLAICSKCADGAEHIYCMRVMLEKVPEDDWVCEECMPKPVCIKSENQTEGVSSTSCLPAKRCGVPLKAQSTKKGRVIGVSTESPRTSNPCYSSHKSFKYGKVKATKSITSQLQISCKSQDKAKAPHGCGAKGKERVLETGSDKKRRDLETRVTFPEASKPSNQSLVRKGPQFKNSGKAKIEAACSVSFVSSSGFQEKPKLRKLGSQTKIAHECTLLKSGSSKSMDFKFKAGMAKGGCLQKQKVERNLASNDLRKRRNVRTASKSVPLNSVSSDKLNATYYDVILENAYRPVVLKNSSSAEQTNKTRGKSVSKLEYPAKCLPAPVSGAAAVKIGNKTTSREEAFSGPNCGRRHAVQGSAQLGCRLQPKSCRTVKDLNCLQGEKKNQSQQVEQPAEAMTAIKVHKLSTGLGSDGRSSFEAAILFKNIVIPKPDRIWLGNFHIQISDGTASQCAGVQAHLSTCASQKVLEVVDKFPDIVVLEALSCLRMWPSQFMESQATEENIALYFFAKDQDSYARYYKRLLQYMTKNDLALKGNIDGVDLLIFPSDVLPEKSQRWNKLLFLWGVFRARKVNNSENTPESSSQKRESRDIASSRSLDLNALPDDDDGYVQGKLPIEDNNADDVGVHGKLAMDGKTDAEKVEVHGKVAMEAAENNAGNFEAHGKLPMEGVNSGDNVEPLGPPFLDDLDWLAAENLVLLSKG